MMRLANMANACHGELLGADVVLAGVTTDSRKDCRGQLFVALRGETFDAHDFVAQAQQQGAVALMVERKMDTELPQILVSNCHSALGEIAAWWRRQFVVPVIGVTGSVGKTTVKEMLAAIFAELGEGLVTEGNLNNEIGVPLTLLRFKEQHQYAIIEMGMNHAGEIARLSEMTAPTIALINNAAAAHLEGLGTVAAVAEAKGEIFLGLQDVGTAVINLDDRHAQLWLGLVEGRRVVSFALDMQADVTARCELFKGYSQIEVSCGGEIFEVTLYTPGKHNVRNALAAVSVAYAANVPVEVIASGLQKYRPIKGRMVIHQAQQLQIIDDSYNANPASMQAAVEVLASYSPSILIVGDMAELGAVTEIEHTKLGQFAAQMGIDQVFACGRFAAQVMQGYAGTEQSDSSRAFVDQAGLLKHLQEHPISSGTVLVKGSRSARMERVVDYLLAANDAQAQIDFAIGRT